MDNTKNAIKLIFFTAVIFFSQCSLPKEEPNLIDQTQFESNGKSVFVSINDLKSDSDDSKLPLLLNQEGDTLTSQLLKDDNGNVMGLLAHVDAEINNVTTFQVAWVDQANYPVFPKKTNIRIGYSANKDKNYTPLQSHVRPQDHVKGDLIYQAEGPIWETEKVAFRAYFDARNGKDIFGKTKYQLCAEQIGVSGNYHELQNWGMDILKVGNSLGAGALAMLKADSLYRLGPTKRAEAKILTNGPLVSQLLLDYDGWEVEGKVYNLEEQINVYPDQQWYEGQIRLEGPSSKDTLVAGMVNLHQLPAKSFEHGGYHVYYTHGPQSYVEDALGMALIVPDEHFISFGAAPDMGSGITNTYTAHLKPSQGMYRHYFYAGWEQEDAGFKQEEFLVEKLKEAIESISFFTQP